VTKGFGVGGRKIELVGQVFNLFGTDNLGGIGTSQTTNALASTFVRFRMRSRGSRERSRSGISGNPATTEIASRRVRRKAFVVTESQSSR
jgi:hypothetical protein